MLPVNSPSAATGAAALSGAMIGPVLVWLCSVLHLSPPPQDVAAVMGALLIMGGHFLSTRLIPIRDGSQAATATVVAPALVTAPPPVVTAPPPVVSAPAAPRPLFDPQTPGKPYDATVVFQTPILNPNGAKP